MPQKISQMDPLVSVSGTESVPVASGAANFRTSPSQLAGYVKQRLGLTGSPSTITSNTTLSANLCGVIFVNATAGNVQITLADAADWMTLIPGLPVIIKRVDLTARNVSIVPAPGDTTSAGSVIYVSPGSSVWMYSDGVSVWHQVN